MENETPNKRKIYEKVEDDFPDGWEEDVIVSSVTTNDDGTLTIRIDIKVSSSDGRSWQTYRKMRLERK